MTWEMFRSPKETPGCAGVYVFLRNGVPYYVGSAVNLRRRFMQHRGGAPRTFGPRQTNHQKVMRECEIKFRRSRRFGDWLMIEARLLRRLQPIGNIGARNGRLH